MNRFITSSPHTIARRLTTTDTSSRCAQNIIRETQAFTGIGRWTSIGGRKRRNILKSISEAERISSKNLENHGYEKERKKI